MIGLKITYVELSTSFYLRRCPWTQPAPPWSTCSACTRSPATDSRSASFRRRERTAACSCTSSSWPRWPRARRTRQSPRSGCCSRSGTCSRCRRAACAPDWWSTVQGIKVRCLDSGQNRPGDRILPSTSFLGCMFHGNYSCKGRRRAHYSKTKVTLITNNFFSN